jgi:hypothetical protein
MLERVVPLHGQKAFENLRTYEKTRNARGDSTTAAATTTRKSGQVVCFTHKSEPERLKAIQAASLVPVSPPNLRAEIGMFI